jgi:hypothetical protein
MSTGLPDRVVERIILAVVNRRGYLDVDLAVELILAEHQRAIDAEPWPPVRGGAP